VRFVPTTIALVLGLAAPTVGASDSLIRLDHERQVPRNELLDAGVPIVAELEGSYLAHGDAGDVARRAAALGLTSNVVADDTGTASYAVAFCTGPCRSAELASCGTTVTTGAKWAVLETAGRDRSDCRLEAPAFVRPLDLEILGRTRPAPEAYRSFTTESASLQPDPLAEQMVAGMSDARAFSQWQNLVDVAASRCSSDPGCNDAATYVYNLFESYGLQPEYQVHQTSHAPSVIGSLPGTVTPDDVYIVIGHLDSIAGWFCNGGPAPGANDNGSGAAMVVALAEAMSCYRFESTVKFLAVTGEEQGLLGSEHYADAAAAAGENILGVLNGDMIGWEGDGNPEDLDVACNSGSMWLGNLFEQAAADYATGLPVSVLACTVGASDHASFWDHGWSAFLGITDHEGLCSGPSGSYPYYHTDDDTIANCGPGAPAFYGAAVRTYLAATAHLAVPVDGVVSAPTGLTAQPAGTTSIDVSWTASPDATGYRVYRAPGGCGDPGPVEDLGTTVSPTFSDSGVSGGIPYAYWVRSLEPGGCASTLSDCAEATTTGPCTEPPQFAGIDSVTDLGTADCRLVVDWSPPERIWCGSDVTYSVYRSLTPGFVPGPSNLVESGLTSTTLTDDIGLVPLEEHHYVVRATDTSNGVEDGNTAEASATPTGPMTVGTWQDDAGDTGAAELELESPWSVVATGGHDGGAAYATGEYGHNQCSGAMTPELTLAAGSVLSFWSKYDIEDSYDVGEVQISTDGGTSWSRLEVAYPGTSSYGSDACGFPDGTYFTGTDLTWRSYSVSLDPWTGESVRVRWVISSDVSVDEAGWWIDDIEITESGVPSACGSGSMVFADSFESGDTSAWSDALP